MATVEPTLDNLPNELLQQIAAYVQKDKRAQTTFHALAGTNNRLHAFFLRFLYGAPTFASTAMANFFAQSLTRETAAYVQELDVCNFESSDLVMTLERCARNIRKISGIAPQRHLLFLRKYPALRLKLERLVLESVSELSMTCDWPDLGDYDFATESTGNGEDTDDSVDYDGDLQGIIVIDPRIFGGFSIFLNCCPSIKRFNYDVGVSTCSFTDYTWDKCIMKRLPSNKIEHLGFRGNSGLSLPNIASMFESQKSSLQTLSLELVHSSCAIFQECTSQFLRPFALRQYRALRNLDLNVDAYGVLGGHIKELAALKNVRIWDQLDRSSQCRSFNLLEHYSSLIDGLKMCIPTTITKLRLKFPSNFDLSNLEKIAADFLDLQYFEAVKLVEWTRPNDYPEDWRSVLVSDVKGAFSEFMQVPRGVILEVLAKILDLRTRSTQFFTSNVNLGPVRKADDIGTSSRLVHVSDFREIFDRNEWAHWED